MRVTLQAEPAFASQLIPPVGARTEQRLRGGAGGGVGFRFCSCFFFSGRARFLSCNISGIVWGFSANLFGVFPHTGDFTACHHFKVRFHAGHVDSEVERCRDPRQLLFQEFVRTQPLAGTDLFVVGEGRFRLPLFAGFIEPLPRQGGVFGPIIGLRQKDAAGHTPGHDGELAPVGNRPVGDYRAVG
jgi:hypothetical protein